MSEDPALSPRVEHAAILSRLKDAIAGIGYTEGLLQENYEFADFLGEVYRVKSIDLAAFTQDPPSYRDASIGVVVANGVSGSALIQGYRSLGASQLFELDHDRIHRWKVGSRGEPTLLESVAEDQLAGLFADNAEVWSPTAVRAAKAGVDTAFQLDFFDSGLIPLLDYQVRTKLDRLLSRTVEGAIAEYERRHEFSEKDYPPLFRTIFRLLAAKLLADRQHGGDWLPTDPRKAIRRVEDFYFQQEPREVVIEDWGTQRLIWDEIKSALHFQNLSVDSLAYVYENTLVSRTARKSFGIHGTPREVAEYIVERLPFEDLAQEERTVFEPFSGHSVFLIAAMQRLRDLLPGETDSAQRHKYFVRMLSGMEYDAFALEVAKLSLMLADYPNPDGWRLRNADVFTSRDFEQELRAANIVLCNPPFERFDRDAREQNADIKHSFKSAEMLARVLRQPPRMLGLVLPRTFLDGEDYRYLRPKLGLSYSSIELVELPDKMFTHSDLETVLVIASGSSSESVHVRSGRVADRRSFQETRTVVHNTERRFSRPTDEFGKTLQLPQLGDIWEATAGLQRLGEMARIHLGPKRRKLRVAEWGREVESLELPAILVPVDQPQGKVKLEPYFFVDPEPIDDHHNLALARKSDIPWGLPRVRVNSRRRSRGAWAICASIDGGNTAFYKSSIGVWPDSSLSLEALAAILNGPLASAFVAVRESKRDIRVGTLGDVPIPDIDQRSQDVIAALVNRYLRARTAWLSGSVPEAEAQDRCRQLMLDIDAEVLMSYDLPVQIERQLLDYFEGEERAGPVPFRRFIAPEFRPNFPLHMHVSGAVDRAGGAALAGRLPSIPQTPSIDEALEHIE